MMYQYLFKWDSTELGQYTPVGGNPSKIWSIPSSHGSNQGQPILGHTPKGISGGSVNGAAMTPFHSGLDTGANSTTHKSIMPIVFVRRMRMYNPTLDFVWQMNGGSLTDLNSGLLKIFRGEWHGAYDITKQRGIIFGIHDALNGAYTRYAGNEWIDINQFLCSNYTYNEPLSSLSKFDVLSVASQGMNLFFNSAFDSTNYDDLTNVCMTRLELEVNTNKLLTSST